MVINISNVRISVNVPYRIKKTKAFENFIELGEHADYFVNLTPVDAISLDEGDLLYNDLEYCVYERKDECCRYFYDSMNDGSVYAKSVHSTKSKTINVEYLPHYMKFINEDGNLLFHIGLEHLLLQEKRMILHAACVDTPYGGVLFTGPSGAGKSTQADLWVKHNDSIMINGDRPVLSKENDGWHAWGSPYAGSSNVHINKNCKVNAIVKVVQSSENAVTELSGAQAFATVFSGITVNNWNMKDVALASSLVIDLINSAPVYELYCTDTEEAVKTLEKVLKGEA